MAKQGCSGWQNKGAQDDMRREILRFVVFDLYDSPIEMTEIARTFRIRLTPLEEVIRRMSGETITV